MVYHPETYYLKPNKYSPNNSLPVLIYRNCLPTSEDKATELLEGHAWVKKGTWGHIDVRHYHPNTHECYGVFVGDSTLLVGCGSKDSQGGQEIKVQAGDVIVLPAGTSHCNTQSSKDYMYVGVYPQGAPEYRYELGDDSINHEALRKEIGDVALPAQDPVNGSAGPLLDLWTTC
ncbi:hypothetical protein IQ07DRAFT_610369 [Pyrenochaeta sp. DS3sAY3a]|nr:hypothetical protein IQ07DRAFT_610369 [Pyrenochaeta sp. DS3sAY3a]